MLLAGAFSIFHQVGEHKLRYCRVLIEAFKGDPPLEIKSGYAVVQGCNVDAKILLSGGRPTSTSTCGVRSKFRLICKVIQAYLVLIHD